MLSVSVLSLCGALAAAPAASPLVRVDGVLDEPRWSAREPIAKVLAGQSDNRPTFGVLADDRYLYVGVRIPDAKLKKDSNDPWQDDAVHVYVDGDGNRGTAYDEHDIEIVKRWNDPGLWVSTGETPAILHAAAAFEGGWSVEVAIPWAHLLVAPASGDSIGLDVVVDDDDDGGDREGKLAWRGTPRNYEDPSGFGTWRLPAGLGRRAPTSSPTAQATASAGAVWLSWDMAPGARRYVVRRKAEGEAKFRVVAQRVDALLWSDTNVAPDKAYEYTVAAANPRGEGPASSAVLARPGSAALPPRDRIELPGGIAIEFALVQPGAFVMGSPASEDGRVGNEAQRRTVITKPLYVALHEVTQRQFRAVMGKNPTEAPHRYADPRNVGPDLPVVGVGFDEAVAFTTAVAKTTGRSVRLPTEAEWEHTCRAGGPGPYGGVAPEALAEYASFGKTARLSDPVGRKKADALGLYDLRGNVWEWTTDWYAPLYDHRTPFDPVGAPRPTNVRVFRGGCSFNKAELQRCAFRHMSAPDYKDAAIGFRLVMDPR